MPDLIYIVFLFLLGACIGSFLNVVVWRLPRNESLVTPPSHCPRCAKMLLFRDNVPILGWVKLGGKCRFCREPISPRIGRSSWCSPSARLWARWLGGAHSDE